MASATPTQTLRLDTIPHPACPKRQVQFFRDWRQAYVHLRDHLLTDPERQAWAVVIPEYRSLLDPEDADACFHFADEAQASQGVSAQGLYDLYRQAAALDAQDAWTLNWVDTADGITVSLGTSGICILVGDVVQTAFLPGQGDAVATYEARWRGGSGDLGRVRGLPRERGMRSGRTPSGREEESAREQRARQRRRAQWTPLEHLYFEVFRRSVQFIKRMHHASRNMYGERIRNDYARLKEKLPRRSQLKFHHWMELRRGCREDHA